MKKNSSNQKGWFRGRDVSMSAIEEYAREVVEKFQPERIVLFGSHAYGKPHDDSDVDILVVMNARNPMDQATRIDRAIDPPFPLDLIVRTPEAIAWRLEEGDSFLQEVFARGKVLYEKTDAGMDSQGRIGLSAGGKDR